MLRGFRLVYRDFVEESPLFLRWRRRRLVGFDYSDPNHVYFVTIRALPETSPFGDERLAEIVIRSLHWLRANRGVCDHEEPPGQQAFVE